MSNAAFPECLSPDPIERAIARRVVRILNDTSLDRTQREQLVRKAQHELIQHRNGLHTRQALERAAAAVKLPAGHRAQSVQVQGGLVRVGAVNKGRGFVWLEAGAAPAELQGRSVTLELSRQGKKQGARVRNDPIAERQRAMGGRRVVSQNG